MLEILVVLAIVAILVGLAVPGFQGVLSRNDRESAMLELASALALARSQAITQSRVLTICRSLDQSTCAASDGADWNAGWIVFTDRDTAGEVNADDTLVLVQGADYQQNSIKLFTRLNGSFTGDYLQFDADGFLANSSTGAWFRFCPGDSLAESARAIWLGNTGRSSLSVDDVDGIHNDLAGDDLACP